MGQTGFAPWPVTAYGGVLLLAAVAYTVLTRTLIARDGAGSTLAAAVGRDRKGLASLASYVAAIPLAFVEPRLSCALYALVAAIWLIPDRRIETVLSSSGRT
jgi:uncharacterized membrane protein